MFSQIDEVRKLFYFVGIVIGRVMMFEIYEVVMLIFKGQIMLFKFIWGGFDGWSRWFVGGW